MRIANYYLRSMRKQTNAQPIWPISAHYRLGDYGYYIRARGKFSVRGNVFDDFGLNKDELVRENATPLFYLFNSSNTVKNEFKASFEAVPATATLNLAFENGRSYVFHLFRAITKQLVLGKPLLDALKANNGEWHHRLRIVEIAYECPDVRFVFSASDTSSVNFSGSVVKGVADPSAGVDYKITASSSMDSSLWMEGAASTPLVDFASFKRRELIVGDDKSLVSDEWFLSSDSSESYPESSETDVEDE